MMPHVTVVSQSVLHDMYLLCWLAGWLLLIVFHVALLLVFKVTCIDIGNSNLVDSASSHTLVSKIKPCMSKYKQLYGETANGSLNQLSFI